MASPTFVLGFAGMNVILCCFSSSDAPNPNSLASINSTPSSTNILTAMGPAPWWYETAEFSSIFTLVMFSSSASIIVNVLALPKTFDTLSFSPFFSLPIW